MLGRAALGIAIAAAEANPQHVDQRYSARVARLRSETRKPCPKGTNPRAWAAMQRAAGAR
jgi:hypothetical protein